MALVQITERLVPFMAAIYIIAGLAVVVLNIGNLIPAIVSIFKGAFTGTAAIGGFAGATISAAIRNGCARGVYSSDAGNGQSSIAYSQSSETDPVKQGMWGIFEVFFDTIVVCTFTFCVIVKHKSYCVIFLIIILHNVSVLPVMALVFSLL